MTNITQSNLIQKSNDTCKYLLTFTLLMAVFIISSTISPYVLSTTLLSSSKEIVSERNHHNKLTTFTNQNPDVLNFIDSMVKEHHFSRKWLENIFSKTTYQPKVINLIEHPPEKHFTWGEYRAIFMKPKTIKAGVDFWYKNHAALSKAEKEYGVPALVIAGILGVETRFGQNTGGYKVIDALSTLVFGYPPREAFFKKELEKFLMFCHKDKIDPQKPMGSYAGAMGLTQFMPSSYLEYAVDFTKSGHADIWNNMSDAIGSIANYLKKHGWERGQKIAVPATTEGKNYHQFISESPLPSFTLNQVTAGGLKNTRWLSPTAKVRGLKLQGTKNTEYWLTTKNFYVITRYNRSDLYAMAVYTLGSAIQKSYHDSIVIETMNKTKKN